MSEDNFGAVTDSAPSPADQPKERERTRQLLVWVAGFSILGFMVCLTIMYIVGKPIGELKDLSTMILSPLITVFGTMVGFYFGSERR